jgi:DNA-binding transcriptional LysR family regulator
MIVACCWISITDMMAPEAGALRRPHCKSEAPPSVSAGQALRQGIIDGPVLEDILCENAVARDVVRVLFGEYEPARSLPGGDDRPALGITARPRYDTGLIDRPIVRLDILAASSRPFSASERKRGIDLRSLCNLDLLVLDRRYQSRSTLDAALRLLSLSPNIFHEGSSATVILALARVGLGTAVVPASTRTDLHTAKIVANGIVLGMDLAAIWDPTLRWRAEVEQFTETLKASFSTHNRSRRR